MNPIFAVDDLFPVSGSSNFFYVIILTTEGARKEEYVWRENDLKMIF